MEACMKERPILFSGPMIRAILASTKSQTRRIVKPQPDSRPGMECTRVLFKNRKGDVVLDEAAEAKEPRLCAILCPYGQPGDRLWVRETHMNWWKLDPANPEGPRLFSHVAAYAADGYELEPGERWIPSIHMLRAASRILLEITAVRVERLQDISEADALAEGVPHSLNLPGGRFARENFEHLWWTINGDGSWESNPWVWVVEFERAQAHKES